MLPSLGFVTSGALFVASFFASSAEATGTGICLSILLAATVAVASD